MRYLINLTERQLESIQVLLEFKSQPKHVVKRLIFLIMIERILVIYMFERFVQWCLKNIKISKDELLEAVNTVDYDADGFITLGEFVRYCKGIINHARGKT